MIADFSELAENEKKKIIELAKTQNLTPEEYIQKSNHTSYLEYERIRQIGAKFGIPVIDGGASRAGHNAHPIALPQTVEKLEFDLDSKTITQTSSFTGKEKETNLFSAQRQDGNSGTPDWKLFPKLEEQHLFYEKGWGYDFENSGSQAIDQNVLQEEINRAQLQQIIFESNAETNTKKIIGGDILTIIEKPLSELQGKGLWIHLPFKHQNQGTSPFSDLFHLVGSSRLQAAEFIVLSLVLPEEKMFKDGFGGDHFKEYLENRNQLVAKLFADYGIIKPIFITNNSVDQNKLPTSFEADLDLKKIISHEPSTITRSNPNKIIPLQEKSDTRDK